MAASSMNSRERDERAFYGLDAQTVETIVREVVLEELSVVEGGVLERFEAAAAGFFGARHAVAVCNGTAALHLALFALDIQPGDEVILPAYGYYAMALPVCMLGGVPVFCDIREADLTLDVEEARSLLTPRTRAVIVHQPWGCPADVDALRRLADRHGVYLMSDSSHAHGALWNGRPLGHYYDFVCASFGKGKLISGGELGVATTNIDRFRDRMLLYGHVNRVPQSLITDEYRHLNNAVGVKYRPHPFAMVLALHQLETYAERSRRLVQKAVVLENGIAELAGFRSYAAPREASRVYWRIPVRVDTARLGPVDSVLRRLEERGCPVERKERTLIPQHNTVTEYYGAKPCRTFPVAERMVQETLQVHPFALNGPDTVDRILSHFRAVAAGRMISDSTGK
jgi:dTDP-4-amino-4,6-dideoxygalactose transaminase